MNRTKTTHRHIKTVTGVRGDRHGRSGELGVLAVTNEERLPVYSFEKV
jgi:hypothetical protein